ncbi:hypothetical protein ACFT8V_28375 [Streptomyces griseoincarnatus]|nr:hypothetical protein [Actinospica acidiphila]
MRPAMMTAPRAEPVGGRTPDHEQPLPAQGAHAEDDAVGRPRSRST